ncbi:MAG: hypothetical protein H0W06_03560 [Chloroflexia bacterium]|nr:hypothetical protein [Chloroflexia bacterium]
MSRISFEVAPELHREVRVLAAAKGITVRQFMLEALEEHLRQEANRQDTEEVFGISGPALQRDWDNEWDAAYDKLG